MQLSGALLDQAQKNKKIHPMKNPLHLGKWNFLPVVLKYIEIHFRKWNFQTQAQKFKTN